MLKRLLLAAALAAGFASPALAQAVPQVIATCGVGVSLPIGPGGRLYQDQTGILCTTAGSGGGGGGGGATGSVTAPGTSGSVAQAVQGITGGVPQNAFSGQYNSTLPTLASGASGYLAVDSNGRLIQSPGASVSVSNFPATQPVSGTVTANIGTTNGLALDSTLSGVATTNSAISTATGTTADAATASGANSTIIGALRAIRDRLLGTLTTTLAAGSANIGSLTNITGTVSLPTGASTAANQTTEITALQAIQQRALLFQDYSGTASAANATTNSTIRDVGTSPTYSKVNFLGYSSQAGTYKVLACQDSACAQPLTLSSSAVTAGGYVTLTGPVVTRYYQVQYVNGGTAASIFGNSSFTAN